MFYVKNGDIKINIDYDNVYNICPKCGSEIMVDLNEILTNEDMDLCETQICCVDCSQSFPFPTVEERLTDMETAVEKVKDSLRIIEKQNLLILTKHTYK